MKTIKLLNLTNKIVEEGLIDYKNNEEDNDILITLNTKNNIYRVEEKTIFRAVSKLREMIYPLELMTVASQKYIICRKERGYYLPTKLGQHLHPREIKPFYFASNNNNFATPKEQMAYMKLYERSFSRHALKIFDLDKNLIILDKSSYFLQDIESRLLNNTYQYFWIYDHNNNTIYDINTRSDIDKFKQNKLSPKWDNLDSFIEWFVDYNEPKRSC